MRIRFGSGSWTGPPLSLFLLISPFPPDDAFYPPTLPALSLSDEPAREQSERDETQRCRLLNSLARMLIGKSGPSTCHGKCREINRDSVSSEQKINYRPR